VLEELAARQPALELLGGEEVVVAPVDLTGTRLARRRGDRQLVAREPLAEPLDQRALADTRRPGYDEKTQTFGALAAQV
jgi:hypothetical protein